MDPQLSAEIVAYFRPILGTHPCSMLSLQPWLQSLAPGIMIGNAPHSNMGCVILMFYMYRYIIMYLSYTTNINKCLVPWKSSWTCFLATSHVRNLQQMYCMSFPEMIQQAGSILIDYDPFPNSCCKKIIENIHLSYSFIIPFYSARFCF